MPDKARNEYPNLILLCGFHHQLVDVQPNTYTIADLTGWKASLEAWVEERLSAGMAHIHFAELQIVCDALVMNTQLPSTALTAVPPLKKMQANGLTDRVNQRMHIGLSQAPQIADFIQRFAEIDYTYPGRLRAGFVQHYDHLRASGLEGDALFLALTDFAGNAATRPDQQLSERWEMQSAALAVLCHLFEICDVFEAAA